MFNIIRSKKMKVLFVLAVIALVLGGVYVVWPGLPSQPETVNCTQEAKLCPDGSYVGRTGPNCEFTACPEEKVEAPWLSLKDTASGISFSYPEKLSTEYIDAFEWPPQVQLLNKSFSCAETGTEITEGGLTEQRIVNERLYCLTKLDQAAAGSTYTQYAYAFANGEQTIVFSFTIRSDQCANYEEPLRAACENEREAFDLDGVVDRMAGSILRS